MLSFFFKLSHNLWLQHYLCVHKKPFVPVIFSFQPDLVIFLQYHTVYHHGDNYNVTNIGINQMGTAWLESSSNFVFWMSSLTVTRILLKDLYQFSSVSQSCPTLRDPMDWSTPGFTNSRSLLKLMSIELVIPSNHLILSAPSPLTFNLAQHQGLFQWANSSH